MDRASYDRDPHSRAWILALGFGTTVAMWAVAYVCRLPVVKAPSWLLLMLLLACFVAGGVVAGRLTGAGWRAGLLVGGFAALLDMLILGSLISGPHPNQVVASALWWIPGTVLIGSGAAALGALVVGRGATPSEPPPDWTGLFAGVAAAATFLLVVAGGLVTGHDAGLAVVDWPNSFGYSMFLYPLSRMTGAIYYEHAHRLFGSLVGLTTVVLAIHLWRVEPRAWVRRLAGFAVVLVVGQGVLGGLRVTGRLTLSTARDAMAPSLTLAVVHGVVGQIFFATMVALAVVATRAFRRAPEPEVHPGAGTDRAIQSVLIGALGIQLVLGSLQRHEGSTLLVHIGMAVIVTCLAVVAGARAWGVYPELPVVRGLGRALMLLVGLQVMLGITALVVSGPGAVAPDPTTLQATLTTAHQAGGALLLGTSVGLTLWTRRLTQPEPRPVYVREG